MDLNPTGKAILNFIAVLYAVLFGIAVYCTFFVEGDTWPVYIDWFRPFATFWLILGTGAICGLVAHHNRPFKG